MQTNSIAAQREAREFRAFQARVEGMSSHLQEMQTQIHEMQTQVMKDDQRMAKLLWVNGMLRDPMKHELYRRVETALQRCRERERQAVRFSEEEDRWGQAIYILSGYQNNLQHSVYTLPIRGVILGKP